MNKEIKQLQHPLEGKVLKTFIGNNEKIISKDNFGKIILFRNKIESGYIEITKVVKEEENYYLTFAKNVEALDIYYDISFKDLSNLLINRFGFKLGWEYEFDYILGKSKEINFLFYNPQYPCIIYGDTIYNQTSCNDIKAMLNCNWLPVGRYGHYHSNGSSATFNLINSSEQLPLQAILTDGIIDTTRKVFGKGETLSAWSYEEGNSDNGTTQTVIGSQLNFVISSLERISKLPDDFFSMFSHDHKYQQLKNVNDIFIPKDKIIYKHWHKCNSCRSVFPIISDTHTIINIPCPDCNSVEITNNNYIEEILKEQ